MRIDVGGGCGERPLGFRILKGDGMIGDMIDSISVSVAGGGVWEIMGLTGRLLMTFFRGG